ncbi:MAG TPA: beta-propeller domain-containing protein, partial [Ilumatobacteraceae bacterium]|nr:beta-propeller domain-containing protein [Ilumatobacteraceae bacterium]
MKRALTVSTAIAVLVTVGCSSDGPDQTSRSTDSRPTPSTLATATDATDPTDPTVTTDPTDPTDPTAPPSTDPSRTGPFGFARLSFFGDCDALLTYMQTEARERVTAWGLDGGYYYGTVTPDMVAAEDSAGGEGSRLEAPAATTAAQGVDYSGTNTQEVGVDEGDIVETDGTYVYVAGQDGLRIVSVADATVVASPELPGGSHQMILDGTRLLVATQGFTTAEDTVVSVFDVSDPTNPALLRRSHLEGRLVASRAAGGTVRLVLSSSLAARLPFVHPDQFGLDEDRSLERNKQIIDESAVQDWLPRWFDEAGDGTFGQMEESLDCANVAAPRDFSGLGVTWIASIDLDGEATPEGAAGIVSTGETVYASTSSLYVATQSWDWNWAIQQGNQTVDPNQAPPTLIHAFTLGEGASATYQASGEVPGRLLNQFAMSEHEGVLRVATTIDDWNTGDSESAVYALRANGDALEQLSVVEGLGAGEQIYAVRFLGPTAYVVTFRQTDPLYVIDMTDPANPALTGELKIPGYSAYLHPVGDGLLLGVGQDATDTGQTLGTQLSLFDVSDPANPQRISTLSIGGWSDVEWDHKAFLFWPEDGTIVLPVSPGWGNCGPQVDCLASGITGSGGGAVVARLDGQTLVGVGTINHESRSQSGCWNPLQRSIAIGDE